MWLPPQHPRFGPTRVLGKAGSMRLAQGLGAPRDALTPWTATSDESSFHHLGSRCLAAPTEQVIYPACRACVAYEAGEHRQRFNLDHTDDICGFALHPNGRLAATGEVGSQPTATPWGRHVVYGWSKSSSTSLSCCGRMSHSIARRLDGWGPPGRGRVHVEVFCVTYHRQQAGEAGMCHDERYDLHRRASCHGAGVKLPATNLSTRDPPWPPPCALTHSSFPRIRCHCSSFTAPPSLEAFLVSIGPLKLSGVADVGGCLGKGVEGLEVGMPSTMLSRSCLRWRGQQVGRRPKIIVWDTTTMETVGVLKGFHRRAVAVLVSASNFSLSILLGVQITASFVSSRDSVGIAAGAVP